MFNLSHILLSVTFILGSSLGYILCGFLSFNREQELIEVIKLKEIEIQELRNEIEIQELRNRIQEMNTY